MHKKSSYLLYGYFGAANFGDDILLYSAIQNILAKDPNAEFLIRNYGDIGFLKEFSDRIHSADFENIHLLKRPTFIKFMLFLGAYWKCIGRCSTLVVGGGTLIHDKPLLRSTFLLMSLCLIAKIRGRAVIGIGLGTKKIHTRLGKTLVSILVKSFDQINLRDDKSVAQCRALLPHSQKIRQTSDLAYALNWNSAENKIESSHKIIAVTLVDYFFDSMPGDQQEKIMTDIGKVLSHFIQDGYRVRLIPLQRKNEKTGAPGDESILKKIRIPEALRQQCEILIIEPTAPSIQAAYDGACLTIGMRFHSLIFSAMRQIPFIGLAHEPKINALCEEFTMPYITTDEISENTLNFAINTALKTQIPALKIENNRIMAQKNFDAFKRAKAH